jgi:hypothetical protein
MRPPGCSRARAPKLRKAVRDAKKKGHACVVVDGTLIRIDRVAADRPFYSGKHNRHGMNLQVIASPAGDILGVSAALPGSVHDKNKPESRKHANRAHAKLRSPGERANAQLKAWRILRKLRCCPWRAGQLGQGDPRPSDPRNRRMKTLSEPSSLILEEPGAWADQGRRVASVHSEAPGR